jgi:predicted transcriptional regulator
MDSQDILLPFFKALADANRLRIVGLLAHRPHAVEELASALDLRPSTVSHHLARLSGVGLVKSSTEGHYHVYALELDTLRERARKLLSTDDLQDLAADPGLHGSVDKLIAPFIDEDGRIKAHPMKRKKFEAVLRYALRLFPDEGPWPEVEVNRRLKALTDDTAMLRRGFIDHRMMTRNADGSGYRRLTE